MFIVKTVIYKIFILSLYYINIYNLVFIFYMEFKMNKLEFSHRDIYPTSFLGIKIKQRTVIEPFDEKDKDSNGFASIRTHGWLTSFFLRILGKVTPILSKEGKTIYLNTKSLKKWLNFHGNDASHEGLTISQKINLICTIEEKERKYTKKFQSLKNDLKNEIEKVIPKGNANDIREKYNKEIQNINNNDVQKIKQLNDNLKKELDKLVPKGNVQKIADAYEMNLHQLNQMDNDLKNEIDKIIPKGKVNYTVNTLSGNPQTSGSFVQNAASKGLKLIQMIPMKGFKVKEASKGISSGAAAIKAFSQGKIKIGFALTTQSIGQGLLSITNLFVPKEAKALSKMN